MSLEEANTSITKEEMSEYEKGICENIRELHTEVSNVYLFYYKNNLCLLLRLNLS